MSYQLGIDLGSTFTAAAVRHAQATEGEPVRLEQMSRVVPSVVYIPPHGPWVVGEAANRRALSDPDRVVREFKRRIGDETPLIVGGEEIAAQDIYASMVHWVVDEIARREGDGPSSVVVTHPAAWGPYKRELVGAALRDVGLDGVTLIPEPVAAAWGYAGYRRFDPGASVAVYDLGGGTFDAAVVTAPGDGFELLGRPEGIEQLGGMDFDESVLEHVRSSIGEPLDGVDIDDPLVVAALARLRHECTDAKETLSVDTDVTIPVMVPGAGGQVRLVRSEFEAMIDSSVDETIEALRRAVSSTGLSEHELSAVLLAGGSSLIPLVAERVSARLDAPLAVDIDPKLIVAVGATRPEVVPAAVEEPEPADVAPPAAEVDELDVAPPVFAPVPPRRRRSPVLLAAAGVVTLVALVGLGWFGPARSSLGSLVSAWSPPWSSDDEGDARGGGSAGSGGDRWTGLPRGHGTGSVTPAPEPERAGTEPAHRGPELDEVRLAGSEVAAATAPTAGTNDPNTDTAEQPVDQSDEQRTVQQAGGSGDGSEGGDTATGTIEGGSSSEGSTGTEQGAHESGTAGSGTEQGTCMPTESGGCVPVDGGGGTEGGGTEGGANGTESGGAGSGESPTGSSSESPSESSPSSSQELAGSSAN